MRNTRTLLLSLAGVLVIAAQSNAISIFSDDFNTENGGANQLNYASFDKWNVSDGTVDLIAPVNTYGLTATDGMFVDLDGSTNDAGVMTTKDSFSFLAGLQYVLTFDLSGNQRGGANDNVTLLIGLGGVTLNINDITSSTPWTPWTVTFTFAEAKSGPLSFANAGGDNIGALLDNVTLTGPDAVPEAGATFGLLALGLAGMMGARRRLS